MSCSSCPYCNGIEELHATTCAYCEGWDDARNLFFQRFVEHRNQKYLSDEVRRWIDGLLESLNK